MVRVNYIEQLKYFIFFVIFQLPVLGEFVLFDKAFGFFYLGFLLFIPFGINRSFNLLVGFIIGLTIDIFSDSPGVHASACVLISFLKNLWFVMISGIPDDDPRINVFTMGIRSFLLYILPLILIHHFMIFSIEHGSFRAFNIVLERVFLSTLMSGTIIFVLNWILTTKPRRI